MNFDEWWNEDYDDKDNPFEKDSFGYWAYAGWCAAMQVEEPVGYADKYDLERDGHDFWVSRQEGKHTVPLYATQPEQETVGWATITNGYPSMWVFNPEYVKNNPNTTVTLYTTPPKREWVSLTDDEKWAIFTSKDWTGKPLSLIDAVLTAYEEKNHD